MGVAEIKGVNRTGLVPFAGHEPEVRFKTNCVIHDGIMLMGQVDAELPKLTVASNDLHQFLDMIHVDMHLGLDARKAVEPSIADIRSARSRGLSSERDEEGRRESLAYVAVDSSMSSLVKG
jgi:hypothetical protein